MSLTFYSAELFIYISHFLMDFIFYLNLYFMRHLRKKLVLFLLMNTICLNVAPVTTIVAMIKFLKYYLEYYFIFTNVAYKCYFK